MTGLAAPRIARLDDLRGIAILLVVLYHCTPDANSNQGLESLVFKIALIGWAGVDLFFALSGFLVCRMLLVLKKQNQHVKVFFWNRLLRIVPIYYLSLILILFALPIALKQPIPELTNTYQFWLYLSNYTLSKSSTFFEINASLQHYWSLALEMQFYLLAPIIIYCLSRRKARTLLLGTWMLIIAIRTHAIYSGVEANATFFFSHYRADALILGSYIATLKAPHKIGPKSQLTLIPVTLFLLWIIWKSEGSSIFKNEEQFYLLRTLLPIAISILSAYALIWALSKKKSNLPSNYLGLSFFAKYSYGIYIYHFTFNDALKGILMPQLNIILTTQNQVSFTYFLIQLVLSSSIAYLSYHGIEKHFLKMKKR